MGDIIGALMELALALATAVLVIGGAFLVAVQVAHVMGAA